MISPASAQWEAGDGVWEVIRLSMHESIGLGCSGKYKPRFSLLIAPFSLKGYLLWSFTKKIVEDEFVQGFFGCLRPLLQASSPFNSFGRITILMTSNRHKKRDKGAEKVHFIRVCFRRRLCAALEARIMLYIVIIVAYHESQQSRLPMLMSSM